MSDLIRREDVVEVLYQAIRTNLENPFLDSMALAKTMAKNIPSVEPERKTGKWTIEEKTCIYGKKYILICSECGESLSVTDSSLPHEKYCRWCGSYMRG